MRGREARILRAAMPPFALVLVKQRLQVGILPHVDTQRVEEEPALMHLETLAHLPAQLPPVDSDEFAKRVVRRVVVEGVGRVRVHQRRTLQRGGQPATRNTHY